MLIFKLEDLDSKFGFEDGDMLSIWIKEHMPDSTISEDIDLHKIMYQLFFFHCSSFIHKKNKIMYWHSSHNPIRYDDDWTGEYENYKDEVCIDDDYVYEILEGRYSKNIYRYLELKIGCWWNNLTVVRKIKNIINFFDQKYR